MTWLLTSDLHLSDRPKDSYRFKIFKWLSQQQQKYNVSATYLLGDLTDRKDNHSSTLVNRIIDELVGLRPPIYLLRGNHDGLNPGNPYFRFLQSIEGLNFVVGPTVDHGVALIPHQPDQASFDRACAIIPSEPKMVVMHQTIAGAWGETGHPLNGLQAPLVSAIKPRHWYSGDVHKPQALPCGLVYVGAPYHIRFGDDFEPRVVLVNGDKGVDLSFPCLRKWQLRVRDADQVLNDSKLQAGDHVMITVELAREEVVEWAAHKQRVLDACRERQLQVFGVGLEVVGAKAERVKMAPTLRPGKDVLAAYCKAEKVPNNIKSVGMELL